MDFKSFILLASAASICLAKPLAAGPAVSSDIPAGWSYYGCYSDAVSDRKLSSDGYTDSNAMTEGSCINYCSSKGYTFAGVEYGSECYCGFGLKSSSVKDSDSACDITCSGSSDVCGGRDRLSVFNSGKTAGGNKATVGSYKYIGCYIDSPSSRLLSVVAHDDASSKTMTVEYCTQTCKAAGYKYAGLEYAGECYCDNSLNTKSNSQVSGTAVDSGCSMLCNGDSTEWCGGKGRLTLYSSTTATPAEQLTCTSFEGCAWPYSRNIGYGVSFSTGKSADLAHSGTGYAVAGGSTSGTNSPRAVCISQALYIANAGTYQLSFYIGGIDNFYQDPRCAPRCAPPQYSLTWGASLNGTSYGGSVYKSGYTSGGARLYSSYFYTQALASGYTALEICAYYDGIRRGQEDAFLLDDVSLVGPV